LNLATALANVGGAEVGNTGGFFMKPCIPLMAILFASAALPLAAQQPTAPGQPANPVTQQTPQAAQPAEQSNPAASPEASAPPMNAAPMSPVKGELISKLDSKSAKVGDDVVVKTKDSVKTADGTEIPKGSKLLGHVIATHASEGGTNAQVALEFDRIELKGGQSLAVHSQIESISPPEGEASPSAGPGNMGMASASPGNTTSPTAASGMSHPGASSPGTMTSNPSMPNSAATAGAPGSAPAASNAPAAGTVVAKSGNIAIQTTSIPGVLLANNAPGEQDPRMAKASSILLGAKQDIKLDSGTQVVVGVSAASGAQ
jgi:hypothetical protein